MSNSHPIGIFDSGVGGLSVARQVRNALPNENIIYLADTFHAPYGDKSQEFIEQRSVAAVEFLLQKGAKAIVVACNTATVSAIQQLRSQFSIPIIGIEPGVKPAISATNSRVIGVLATEQTLLSRSFANLAVRFSAESSIEIQPCPGLVEQVENMDIESTKTYELLQRYIHPLLKKGADTIVLGCTHYAYLSPAIEDICGHGVEIINTHAAVAKEVSRRVMQAGLANLDSKLGHEQFWTSGDTELADRLFSQLWGEPISLAQMEF